MSRPVYNAWRFVHPDLDASGPFGEQPAFVGLGVSERGSIAMVGGDSSVRQAVLLLLSTAPANG